MAKKLIILGLFISVVTVFTFIYIILVSGKITSGTYILYAHFNNANGMRRDTSIKISGVKIGRIQKIELDDGRAKITLEMSKEVKMYSDDIVKRTSQGILGAAVLEIIQKKTGRLLKNNDIILNVEDTGLIESIASGAETTVQNIGVISNQISSYIATSGILDQVSIISKQLEQTLLSVNKITESFAANIDVNTLAITQTTAAIAAITQELQRFLVNDKPNNQNQELSNTLTAIRNSLQNIEQITANLKDGKGTIGKLLTDDSVFNNIESLTTRAAGLATTFDYKFEGLFTADGEFTAKNHINLLIEPPKSSRYYQVGITYGDTAAYDNTPAYTSSLGDSGVKINLLLAQTFGKKKWLTVRGGLIENTGGVGIDIRPVPQWEITSEAFDFGSKNGGNADAYIRAQTYIYPFLNPNDKYNPLRWIYFGGGVDDALAKYKRAYFFGIGLRFKDEFIYDAVRLIPLAGAATTIAN